MRKKQKFRDRHPVLFNAMVAFITSLICNILLNWFMPI